MAKIDLEKYKNAWKQEQTLGEQVLSESEIASFLRSSSKHIVVLFRRSLVFDLVFKGILLGLLVALAFMMPYSAAWLGFCLLIIALLMGGMAWQFRTKRSIPDPDQGAENALALLRQYIAFYYQHYYHSIFVGAFSSVFFFLIGSSYYYFFKYREIPSLDMEDVIVLGVGLVLSFTLSAFAQVKQGNFQIGQLEERVKEIEEHNLSTGSLEKHRNKRVRNYTLIGLALIVGLLLLLYLIYNYSN